MKQNRYGEFITEMLWLGVVRVPGDSCRNTRLVKMSPPKKADGKFVDIEQNYYWKQFDQIKILGVQFARRVPVSRRGINSNLFIIEGDNGIGKSNFFKRILPTYGVTVKSETPNGNNIGEKLIMNNDKNTCILFDDANNVIRSTPCLEVVNKASDTADRFIPSHRSMRGLDNEMGLYFYGRIVISTNLVCTDFKRYPMMQSIMSRVGIDYVSIRGNKDDRYHYAGYIATEEMRPNFENKNVTPQQVNEVLRFFAQHKDILKDPSPRTFELAIIKRGECSSLEQFLKVANRFIDKPPGWTPKPVREWREDLWVYDVRPKKAGVGSDYTWQGEDEGDGSGNKTETKNDDWRDAKAHEEAKAAAEEAIRAKKMDAAREEARGKSKGYKNRTGEAWYAYVKACDVYVDKMGSKPDIPTKKNKGESDEDFARRRASVVDARRKWMKDRPEPPRETK